MITTESALRSLQRQLDDSAGELFTRDQLLNFMQEGYDKLCREGECLFDVKMYDTQPRAANYTKEFERQFIDGPVYARFTCTRESDAEFTEGNALVSNHTKPSDQEYMTEEGHTPTITGLRELPAGYVSIDRVTHDTLRLEPQHDRYNRLTRTDYQTLQGGVFQYQMDQDGWRNIRLVNVPPSDRFTTAIVHNGDVKPPNFHGVIRAWTGTDSPFEDDEPVIGTFGLIRSVPQHFVTGDTHGAPRQILEDGDNTRIEYFRLGNELEGDQFELPDRMVKYVLWWALHRAYSTPGEAENLKLSEHFKQRFQSGVDRIKTRMRNSMRERTMAMGSKRTSIRDNYLEHFPADYGYSRPFRG